MTTRRIAPLAASLLIISTTLFAADKQAKAAAPAKPPTITVLKDLSLFELQHSMSLMKASLGVGCDFCHVQEDGDWDFANEAKEEKQTAREMILMVRQMNQQNFGGRPVIGCYTCHHGSPHPTAMPPLPQPVTPPNASDTHSVDRSSYPQASALVAKYLEATGLGKAEPSKTGARVMRGSRTDASGKTMTFEIAQSGDQRLVTTATPAGDVQQFSNGHSGWVRDAQGVRIMKAHEVGRFEELTRSLDLPHPDPDAAGYRVVGKDRVNDRDVWVVERKLEGGVSERFSFDAENGLLLRVSRVSPLPVGRMPEQVFYADYRDASGLTVPFEIRADFVDPRLGSVRKFETIDYTAKVDPAKFEMPK